MQELKNIFDPNSDIVKRLKNQMLKYLGENNLLNLPKDKSSLPASKDVIEKLKSLGY